MSLDTSYIIQDKVSNRVTRSLNMELQAPGCVLLDIRLREYPNKRKKKIEELTSALNAQYEQAQVNWDDRVSSQKSKLTSEQTGFNLNKNQMQRSIASLTDEVQNLKSGIESMEQEIKKETRSIRWLQTWRVFWGIICTFGGLFKIAFFIFGIIFSFLSIFFPSSKDDDD